MESSHCRLIHSGKTKCRKWLGLIVSATVFFSATLLWGQEAAPNSEAMTNPETLPDHPSGRRKLSIGVVRMILPQPKDSIVLRTTRELSVRLGERFDISVREYSLQEMDKVVCGSKVDLFIASSGFYRLMQGCGAKDLAASISNPFPNANRSEGTAVVTLASKGLDSWASLQGKRAAVSSREAFAGYWVPMREIARRGYDWESFFGSVDIVGNVNHVPLVLDLLKEGKTDVVFLKQCLLEIYEGKHPERRGMYRVVEPRAEIKACKVSSELYPALVIASTKRLDTELAAEITQILLSMKGDDIGVRWSVATDFSSVDALHRALKIGPYEYLREWTVRRVLETYWEWIVFFLLLLVGGVIHSWRVSVLLRRNTQKLEATMREREELLEQKAQAHAQLQSMQGLVAVNQMSSIFAHEMMTPLATMSLQLAVLKELIDDERFDAGIMKRQIDKLMNQTHKAEDIVERVRSYRRSWKRPFAHLNLSQVAARVLDEFEGCYPALRRVPVQKHIEPGVEIYGDELQIEILVLNLLKNACEACMEVPGAGVEITVGRCGSGVFVRIVDTGPLASQEELDRLTASFRESRKENGLGLGLLIVRGIVEQHKAVLNLAVNRTHGLSAEVRFSWKVDR